MRTMVRYDIYNDFKLPDHVAYCYQGEAVGSLAIYDKDEDNVKIFTPKGYLLDDEIIQKNLQMSKEQFHTFELWAYIHEIEDEEILQCALNTLYYVYCSFFVNSNLMQVSQFKGFNESL